MIEVEGGLRLGEKGLEGGGGRGGGGKGRRSLVGVPEEALKGGPILVKGSRA